MVSDTNPQARLEEAWAQAGEAVHQTWGAFRTAFLTAVTAHEDQGPVLIVAVRPQLEAMLNEAADLVGPERVALVVAQLLGAFAAWLRGAETALPSAPVDQAGLRAWRRALSNENAVDVIDALAEWTLRQATAPDPADPPEADA